VIGLPGTGTRAGVDPPGQLRGVFAVTVTATESGILSGKRVMRIGMRKLRLAVPDTSVESRTDGFLESFTIWMVVVSVDGRPGGKVMAY